MALALPSEPTLVSSWLWIPLAWLCYARSELHKLQYHYPISLYLCPPVKAVSHLCNSIIGSLREAETTGVKCFVTK